MAFHGFDNHEIAKILKEMAAFLGAEEVAFKPQAYEKAALTIEAMDEELTDLYKEGGVEALDKIPGVGKGIAERIEELFTTGHIKDYEKLKKKYPVNIGELIAVEGLGPKNVLKLYKKLKIKTLKDLEKAAKAGEISKLEGFGEKSEKNILKGINFLKKSGGRFILGFEMDLIKKIEDWLKNLKDAKKVVVAGSVRRMKETIGDVDILVVAKNSKKIMDAFTSMPWVAHIYARGETKSSVKLKNGMDADLRVVPEKSYGAALNYFTGSKEHNIALREIAIKNGYKLSEYGLFKGKYQIAGKTEEDLYKALGMDYIPPEMREMQGELELAQKNKLPELIPYESLKGDLQIQSNWTDGENSIEEMARAAMKAGLEYIVITDHTKNLAMTGGLDEKKILRQWKEIDKINLKFKNQNLKFRVLKGSECDILRDGKMDLSDKILAQLDVVGGAIHSYFNLPRKEQTERIIRAMKNPHVDIIFHPTGRILNRREAYDVDMEKIIKTAKATGTVLEIDAYPDRLDLKDEYIKMSVEAGVKLAIDSDAHSVKHFEYLKFGIAQARRGWAKKSDIVNAWPLEKMLSMLKSPTLKA